MQPHETLGISSDSELEKMKQAYAAKASVRHTDIPGRYVRDERTCRFSPGSETRKGAMHAERTNHREHRAPPPIAVPQRSCSNDSAASTFIPSPLSIGSYNSISTTASSIAENLDDVKPFHQSHASPTRENYARKASLSDGLNSAGQSSTLVDPESHATFHIRAVDKAQQYVRHIPQSEAPKHDPKPFLVTAGPALQPLGRSDSGNWTYSLSLSLEDLFHGMHSQFGIVRRLRSGQTKNVVIELDIPPGCCSGTQILCRGVGNELPTGKLEDVTLVIEELPHRQFRRMGDDLVMDVQIPWTSELKHHPRKIDVVNIDNEPIEVFIDYSREKSFSGNLSIRNAGMPIRERGRLVGRGNLIVRWEISQYPRENGIQSVFSRFFRHGPSK